MTSTFELDPETVKTNQLAKYSGPGSLNSKVVVQALARTHIGQMALPRQL